MEYINSPENLNPVVLVIILFGAINLIFLFYSVSKNFNRIQEIKEENKKRKAQEEKLNKLYPPTSE
tara:strand:- start:184 stop:381 length:198 start_codon:yes stop_codon:yes gene_type:complete